MASKDPLFQGLPQAALRIPAGAASHLRVQLGKALLPSSLLRLMSGLSSSQVVGRRASVPNELMSHDLSCFFAM